MKTKPITAIYLDTRRKKQDESYPVKLRVTYKRVRKYYALGKISMSEEEFGKVMGTGLRGKYKKIRKDLDDYKHEADEIINNMKEFSFDRFEKEFLNMGNDDEDVFSLFQSRERELRGEGRISTAETFQYAHMSLQAFHRGKKLPFEKITVDFLNRYEKHALSEGKSMTTIGIYMRNLRAVVNIARSKGMTDVYPFGRANGLYRIKNPPARKMALTTEELAKIFNYEPSLKSPEHFYLDLWKFSYLCNGMNVKDICMMKRGNIVRDKILYRREKTRESNPDTREIAIPILDEVRMIINDWSDSEAGPEDYLFPILSKGMDVNKIHARIKQTTKQINNYIRRIAERLDIDVNVSTYTARHSYATQLMRTGAPTEFISKQLGHTNLRTTENYLENFEDRQTKEWQKKLTEF